MDGLSHAGQRLAKALEIGQQALQYHQKNSSVLYRLAGCKFRLGNKNEALLIFDQIKNEIKIPKKINHLFPELIKFNLLRINLLIRFFALYCAKY